MNLFVPYNNEHPGPKLNQFQLCLCIGPHNYNPVFDIIIFQPFKLRHGDDADFSIDICLFIIIDHRTINRLADILRRRMGQNINGHGSIIQAHHCQIGFGHHTQKVLFFVHHTAVGMIILLHDLQRLIDGRVRRNGHWCIHSNLRKLHPGILQKYRFRKPKAGKQITRLIIQCPQTTWDCVHAHGTLEKCVCDG